MIVDPSLLVPGCCSRSTFVSSSLTRPQWRNRKPKALLLHSHREQPASEKLLSHRIDIYEDLNGSPLADAPPMHHKQEHSTRSDSSRGWKRWWSQCLNHQTSTLLGVVAGGGILASSASFLETPASFAEAIGILALIVAVHEMGHFMAARLQNIHVTRFAIGFGPPIVKYQGPKVEYSLRAFPLGGFVGFPDDDPANPYAEDDPDLFRNRPIAQRALVISAGVLANLLFAYSILLTQVSFVGVVRESFEPGVKVTMVFKDSVGQKSGLKVGDLITQVADEQLAPGATTVPSVVSTINNSAGSALPMVVQRDGSPYRLSVTPDPGADGKGRVGIQLGTNSRVFRERAKSIVGVVMLATEEFVIILGEMVHGLQQIIFNFSKTSEQVSGPVAIVAVGAEVARYDAAQLFTFAAVINMNLAVVNALPLPALDGGYLALLILEAIRGGKKLPENIEQGVMASGLVFLLAVGIGLVVRDTVHLSGL